MSSNKSCSTCFYGPVRQKHHTVCDACFTLNGKQFTMWVADDIYTEEAAKEAAEDKVNKPKHYNYSNIQPIDAIEAWNLNFRLSNVIKYVARHKQKNGLEDLKKAAFYLQREIDKYDTNV